ncbi:type IV secretion system protein [Paraburkholderia phosphatilytica]|uniref:type IV secretion system protein n=1 Tax=Paraburkholderia phosphatilytica TaxID=2282883 RepID=UPI000E4C144D|nr:type IV secretion system protein [Paraburkholderia phosphatilytica]
MSGLFSAVGGTLENGMSTYVTGVSSALSSALVTPVSAALGLWVTAWGFAVMRGDVHEPVPAFAWRGLKVAIMLAFALGTGVYQDQLVTAIDDTTSGLAQIIVSAAASAGAGNTGCGSVSADSVTASSASTIYDTLDCYDRQVDLVMDAYFDKATHEGFSVSGIVAGVGDFICGLVAALGASIFLIVLAFEVVMARMLLDLVLGLGPVFIACGAFGPGVRFFDAWVAKVANYALLQVLIAAFLGMALTAFSADLAPFSVTGAAPDTNATALAAAARTALDSAASWSAGLGMFASAVLLAAVGWQLPGVAAGLTGGATLSGSAAFIAGYASRQAVRAIGAAMRAGHAGQPAGSSSAGGARRGTPGGGAGISGAGARGGTPGAAAGSAAQGSSDVPAYQRAAHSELAGWTDHTGGESS